jgi:hypothetical protein
MEQARYKYMELTSEDPQAFGKQLTRVLGELRSQGCEIVNVSLDLVAGANATGAGPEGMLRTAQILILDPGHRVARVTSSESVMN